MAVRDWRVLTIWLMSAVAAPGCALFPGWQDRPRRVTSEPRELPVRQSSAIADAESRKPLPNPTPKPPADAPAIRPVVSPTVYPSDPGRPSTTSATPPASPRDLQLPPAGSAEGPSMVVKPVPPLSSAPPQPVIMTALQQVLDNRPDRALDAIQRCPPNNQKLLMLLLPLVADLADGKLDAADPAAAERLNDQLNSAESELRLPLSIARMFFCRDVKSFGCYDPLPPRHEFRAGSDDRRGEMVHVYLELRNLSARQKDEFYDSMLSSKVEIRDSQDNRVSLQEDPNALFRSRSLRNDIFLQCQFEVPRDIPPGTYTLWIEITDTYSRPQRVTRKSIEMRIGH